MGPIVSGTAANKATETVLAAYPEGIVDRVVLLSNGDYNVHIIGVSTGRTTSSSIRTSRSSGLLYFAAIHRGSRQPLWMAATSLASLASTVVTRSRGFRCRRRRCPHRC